MNMNRTGHPNSNTRDGFSYVYASYVLNDNPTTGYVAVIDPGTDKIIKRLQGGHNPTVMCLSPSGDKLYVVDVSVLYIYSTETFIMLNGVYLGATPVAVYAEPTGKKVYIANYDDGTVTVINGSTNAFIKTVSMDTPDKSNGRPFAFASNKNSRFIYISCLRDDDQSGYVIAMDIDNDALVGLELTPGDQNHNPLTVAPDGKTLITLGPIGYLNYYLSDYDFLYVPTSLLDNTVSGIYLDSKMLFCTLRDERNFLKVLKNLTFDLNGNIVYDKFIELPSYKGQDKIRTSPSQKYVGITVQPTDFPQGGLQIIDTERLSSEFIPLYVVGDMTLFSDTKAYVGEINAVRPINLATATALPAIDMGGDSITVKNIISGYSNQSTARNPYF
ncbi:YncE family protein [Paenibacillus piscarius]|uniref:YncE family protein n=1 Tax=Paenibacillus piscarius TaxID=1089681 RepID=UPI001EE8A8C8|nr:YncE family protein [Paenibacillus piscarius]